MAEVDAAGDEESDVVLALGVQSPWVQDLPLCFPGRACVDVPPGGAQAMYLISDLTSTSAWIALALGAGLAVSLVLLGRGLWRQWHGVELRPWLVLLAIALVVGGVVLAWLMNGWLGEAGVVYGGLDGRPAEPTPSSVISSWPLVQIIARTSIAVGAFALFLMLNTSVVRQHRGTRARENSPS